MKPFASSARGLVADLIISQGENYTCLVILRQVEFSGDYPQVVEEIKALLERGKSK